MSSGSAFPQWLRHHASSIAAAVVDFGVMVAIVELFAVSPVVATAIGAATGALTNFLLGRHWTYRSTATATVPRQAVRYAVVSAASLGMNTVGEHLFVNVLHVQYLLARVITAVIVSNLWNYPMQRFFVFASRGQSMDGKAAP